MERPATRPFVAAHHRVLGLEPARLDGGAGHGAPGQVVAAQGLLVFAGAVDRPEPVEQPAQAGREALVGQVHVGEKGVAAPGRDILGIEQGAERGALQVGRVAVPDAAEIGGLPGLLDHRDDIGVFGDGLGQGVAADRPEARREGDLLDRGQFLVAEEQHQVIEEGALDALEGPGIQRPGQVEPMDFGAEAAGQGSNFDRGRAHGGMRLQRGGGRRARARRGPALGIISPGRRRCIGCRQGPAAPAAPLAGAPAFGVASRRPRTARRGAGVVERGGLENRCTRESTVGSNPTPSATT